MLFVIVENMSQRCILTGKGPLAGNNVSHAHNKTRKRQLPNLHYKSIFVPELRRSIRIRLSANALRTVTKMGLLAFMRKRGLRLKDIT